MVALGALVLGACGDDDDAGGSDGGGGDVSEEEQPYVDAMVTNFQDSDEELTMSEEQAQCVAPRWMDAIGLERLQEAGIEPADIESDDEGTELTSLGLDEEAGGELYDAFGACDVDVKALFVESLAQDSGLSDEDRECVEENFDDDLLRRVMVASLTQGEEALQQDEELTSDIFAVFAECPGAAG